MIRLVTQFDSPRARASAATPTCGGCCCCCCSCIVTAIGASVYTARSAQRILHAAEHEAPERVRLSDPLPGVIGFFALPLGLLAVFLGAGAGIVGVVLGLGLWYWLVGLAYMGAGGEGAWGRAVVVVLIASFALVAEFFLWLALIFGAV